MEQTVVGLGGFEPPTSPLSGVRSNHLSYKPTVRILTGTRISVKIDSRKRTGPIRRTGPVGGDDRDRTDGLRRARAALSQLSYIPTEQYNSITPAVSRQHSGFTLAAETVNR
jgi:hypothetical protein